MATVTFDKATRLYPGSTKPAVDQLDLAIGDGEFLVLVGPSGCGKSTSLRMLAGLEQVDGGRVPVGDRDVTHLAPHEGGIAFGDLVLPAPREALAVGDGVLLGVRPEDLRIGASGLAVEVDVVEVLG